MASGKLKKSKRSVQIEKWLSEAEKQISEISVPGYWKTLEENCKNWSTEVAASPYWIEAKALLKHWNYDYRLEHKDDLLTKLRLPSFHPKGIERIREKIAIKIGESKGEIRDLFSDEAVVPVLNDLVRTRISCKYIDGVDYISKQLTGLAKKHNLSVERSKEGKLEGYFAQHIVVTHPIFYRVAGLPTQVALKTEIQVATDMSTRIWESTHSVYEEERVNPKNPEDWQWAPKDPRFVAHQLGHMIHLADGLLVQLRDSH